MDVKRGVYFLAHDGVIDLVIAFLNSFRRFNPTLSLCLIPFNEEVSEISRLREEYDFLVYNGPEYLIHCDEISRSFFSTPCGQFRKLAAWEGLFDEFIYVDIDTVVQHPFDFCFDYLELYGFVTSHSNLGGIRKWVWRDSIYSADSGLSEAQIAYSANTGFIVSRRGLLSRNVVSQRVTKGAQLAEHMELQCTEQPFLNYLIVTSGVPYTSLLSISRQTGSHDIPLERWAGKSLGKIDSGKIIREEGDSEVLIVHWAGEWQSGRHERNPLWRYYRDLGISETCPEHSSVDVS
jgi:hypothetical protein